jgi:hypothetical protein
MLSDTNGRDRVLAFPSFAPILCVPDYLKAWHAGFLRAHILGDLILVHMTLSCFCYVLIADACSFEFHVVSDGILCILWFGKAAASNFVKNEDLPPLFLLSLDSVKISAFGYG